MLLARIIMDWQCRWTERISLLLPRVVAPSVTQWLSENWYINKHKGVRNDVPPMLWELPYRRLSLNFHTHLYHVQLWGFWALSCILENQSLFGCKKNVGKLALNFVWHREFEKGLLLSTWTSGNGVQISGVPEPSYSHPQEQHLEHREFCQRIVKLTQKVSKHYGSGLLFIRESVLQWTAGIHG